MFVSFLLSFYLFLFCFCSLNMVVSENPVFVPPRVSSEQVSNRLINGSVSKRNGVLKRYEMLGIQKNDAIQETLPYEPPSLVEGAKIIVFSDEEIKEDVNRCEGLVVCCFVGNRLPFLMVKLFVQRSWKLKRYMKMTLHGDSVFVF